MSSLPGHTLEDFLAWSYSLTIEEQAESNFSLGFAEVFGTTVLRPHLTKKQFAPIVAMFEIHRERIEHYLDEFDEENQSWRDYAGAVFNFITEEMDKQVFIYLAYLKGNNVEYILKETIQLIKANIINPPIIKGLTDAIALMTAYGHYETPDQSNLVKARVSTIISSINAAIVPTPFEYLTGYGMIARYLREHLAVQGIFAADLTEQAKLVCIREEIDKKFNYQPNNQLDSFEWKQIIKELINLNNIYFTEKSIETEDLWEKIQSTSPITKTGLYTFNNNNDRMINLVFTIPHVNFINGIQCTVSMLPGKDPTINVYHEWEERNINIFNVCFFPGMYSLMMSEIEKLTKV